MRLLIVLIGLALATSVLGDVIVLKDGTRLEGAIRKTDKGWQITSPDGKVREVTAAEVRAIELGTRDNGAAASGVGLASLRRSVEALDDLNQIIERYERFIANTTDADVLEQATGDLETWQQRRSRGLVKQGTEWMTPDDAAQVRRQALDLSATAREMLRQGRLAEAETQIRQALAVDPGNAAATYLQGVTLYRQDRLVDARRAFESVNAGVPNHGPTLNNLAVILGRQNAQGASFTHYDQAMQAAPVNKFILDNVAEALGSLSDEQRRGQAMQRVVRRFTEQDTILQKQLSPQGLYRWGSTWVDQKQLDELRKAEREILDRIAELEQEFEENKRRIAEIDIKVNNNHREMADLRARSVWRDADGRLHRMPLPARYYELQTENDRLRNEQETRQQRFAHLRDAAQRTRQQLPTPRFTGVQQIVGVEGTPLLDPQAGNPAPAPLPATRSAS